MIKKHYTVERNGQIDFFNNYIIDWEENDSILVEHTDGIYHGNLLEFKLNIDNTGKVLFQAIKYLSHLRIKGESVPAKILLIDLNNTEVYEYNSIDYIDDIQKPYVGEASKNNESFDKNVTPINKYDYSESKQSSIVKKLLINNVPNKKDWYIPIDIDENCIVGWAKRYYRENPQASKGDFLGDAGKQNGVIGEIRDPKYFKGLINPYTQKTNKKFKYLMDCLNDQLNKKDLGAYYTPPAYCEKASELVMKAVNKVPDGNDYIILDRCAGTGNLETALINKYDKNGDELISHCIVSTYEYYEYKVLSERIGDIVRDIIPPTEMNIIYDIGKIKNADAMSKEYVENSLIREYIDNDKCTIILFENPPYDDSSSIRAVYDSKGKKHLTKNKESYIYNQMKKEKNKFRISNISTVRDFANRFIWSAFKYYLRQDTDSYIVFSPVKYFKSIGLISDPHFKFDSGFLFNRKHFHATPSAISCVLWSYGKQKTSKSFVLEAYDIDDNGKIDKLKNFTVKEVYIPFSNYNQKYIGKSETSVTCDSKGNAIVKNKETKSYNDSEVIGYFCPGSASYNLGRLAYFNGRGMFVTKDNIKYVCPLFTAKLFPRDNWFEKDFYFTTGDGGNLYMEDNDFLKMCLIYTCLSHKNRCLSLNAQDGKYYRNELCFDTTNGNTFAFDIFNDEYQNTLNDDEKKLIAIWNNIIKESKKCSNYNKKLTYGVYQISNELNTFHYEGTGVNKKKVSDYPTLNGYLKTLRNRLKTYYLNYIKDKIFKYKLIK